VLLTAKHPNQNVKQYVKNQNVTGNVINQTAQNPNVNWYAKIPTVYLKLSAVCQNGGGINPGFPFFKETETNKACCGCGNNNPSRGAPTENPQITNIPDAMLNTFPKSTVIDNGTHYLRVDKTADVNLFKNGRPLSNGRYGRTTGRDDEWEKQRGSLNLNLAYHDRH